MAILLSLEIRDSDNHAEYWVVTKSAQDRDKTTNNFSLQTTFSGWKDEAAYAAGKKPEMSFKKQVYIPVLAGNQSMVSMGDLAEAEIIKPGEALAGGVIVA